MKKCKSFLFFEDAWSFLFIFMFSSYQQAVQSIEPAAKIDQ
jgi:hypothetical protein